LTTRIYHEAIQSVYNNTFSQTKVALWMEELKRVYNRGFWDGYYLGRTIGEWTDREGSSASELKEYIGFVSNYFAKINVAEVYLDAGQLNVNDRIYIIGPNTGVMEFKINELRDNNGNVIQFSDKNIVSFKVPSRVRKNDKVYLIKNRNND